MRPGISVRPLQSITSAFCALIDFLETSRMVGPSTSTETPPFDSSAWGSSSLAFLNRTCAIQASVIRVRSVVMAMRAMHMTVLDFFRRCCPNVQNATVETQSFARPRVIAVQHDFAVGNVGDREDDAAPWLVVRLRKRLELHANLNVGRQLADRFDLDELGIVLAESGRRLHVTRARG